jgi:hypothetical protein
VERKPLTIWGAAAVLVLGLAMPAGAAPVDKMIGGGSIGDPDLRVTLGMTLPCTTTDPGAELEINWFDPQPDPPGRESFHLTRIEGPTCNTNSPSPNDGGTHGGKGTGLCKTQTGSTVPANVEWNFMDSALGGPDTVQFTILSLVPACNLTFNGPLDDGNLRMIDNPSL